MEQLKENKWPARWFTLLVTAALSLIIASILAKVMHYSTSYLLIIMIGLLVILYYPMHKGLTAWTKTLLKEKD